VAELVHDEFSVVGHTSRARKRSIHRSSSPLTLRGERVNWGETSPPKIDKRYLLLEKNLHPNKKNKKTTAIGGFVNY